MSADLAAARIDHMIEPVYPKDADVQGTIVLHAVIDTDGSIQSMEYVSGPTRLMRAALDAAHLWHYKPMKTNGQPVEVDTTINVVFALDVHGHLKPQPRIWPNVANAPKGSRYFSAGRLTITSVWGGCPRPEVLAASF